MEIGKQNDLHIKQMIHFTSKRFEDLSKMLIWHRKKSKITQQTLADLAAVSRTAVQRLENGNVPVQIDTLWKVLEILNIKMCYSSPIMSLYMKDMSSENTIDKEET